MFDSLEELSAKLAGTGYFIDQAMIQVVFLAAKLQKPLLLEGPAGSGKTQLALSVAAAAGTHLLRAGVDINTIRAWLGHVSIDTTNIYVEVDLERKAQMLEKTNALRSNPVSKRPWKDNPSLMAFLRSL